MAIQWFPGHMNSTRKALLERVKLGVDVVIELLDARLPGSSANPMLAELMRGRPTLKVLNKQDLADPARTELWLAHYNGLPGTSAIGLDASVTAPAQRLITSCRTLAPNRKGLDKPMRVLICGIPNVGKSTLINTLLGKRAAKTGDEPGITRNEQLIALASDFHLIDTPGMLWPKIIVERSGYHLAASGAVGRNAYDEEEVSLVLIDALRESYPGALEARFKVTPDASLNAPELLEVIGRKRGAVLSGGRINLQKAAEMVLHEFRAGGLGRITLETPAEFTTWLEAAREAEAERQRLKSLPRKGARRQAEAEVEDEDESGVDADTDASPDDDRSAAAS
ncbi:ribosome biogenesis GTPase A [Sphaerotilus hippei]|uniref:Ribosome biogenesis GTPase A n=1 Tax=Sphaerotilus hippei TaxID=744406 RepID=A0A318H2X5_9BURK|nr:ribosome biogenesis GTPase YlqF [Sphaerotilus hippei]PXW92416.1 ribosome biogenesis GTPase A [Sphaerotilus hippei]